MPKSTVSYGQSVFINCPFDDDYQPILRALVFAVHDCGLTARGALELSDSGETRIAKLHRIIEECQYGIHDISRTELDVTNNLPRFNMPFELGLFLGALRYGDAMQQTKRCMILDTERFRYQKFLSDIAGQDIAAHHGNADDAITAVRAWLQPVHPNVQIPGGTELVNRFGSFRDDLALMQTARKLVDADVGFVDLRSLVVEWLQHNPW